MASEYAEAFLMYVYAHFKFLVYLYDKHQFLV